MLRPFLCISESNNVIGELSEVLGIPIQKREDVVCQDKVLITYKGYRLDILDLRWIKDSGFSISIQFKMKKNWSHGIFTDQNKELVNDLERFCRQEIKDLTFKRFSTTVSGDSFLVIDTDQTPLVFFHDSQAFNPEWKAGRDISPLLISPDSHHGNCFVEFQFNPAAYMRQNGTTMLRSNWRQKAFLISEEIENEAKRRLGLK